jgi:mannose-1-phosphate guanylyltransferase
LLNITGERSIIRQTVDRIKPLIKEEDIYVVTVAGHAEDVANQLPMLPRENIIVEPVGRNTAPCIGLVSLYLKKKDPGETMIVLPADHLIADEKWFIETVAAAGEAAERSSSLITIGITPAGPETGYGYVEKGKTVDTVMGRDIFAVESFREKPDIETAKAFVREGNFLWNSGMFVWKVSTILGEIERHLPDLYKDLLTMDGAIGSSREEEIIDEVYRSVTPISIDYGVMEKAENVLLIKGEFGWNDVGSWDALWEILDKDADENAVVGTHISIESSQNLVYSPDKLVTLVGVKDIILVETGDSIMVCKRGASQDVKKAVEVLEAKKMKDYL